MKSGAPVSVTQTIESEADISKTFKCDKCDFVSNTDHGVKVHKGTKHKETQQPEVFRAESTDKSLILTPVKEPREEDMEETISPVHLESPKEHSDSSKETLDSTFKHHELSPEIPLFKCPFCDNTFTSNVNQHWHAVSCPKNFRGQENLRQGELMNQQALRGGFPPWYPRYLVTILHLSYILFTTFVGRVRAQ